MDEWVRIQYREAYCNEDGELVAPKVNLDTFRDELKSQRPDEVKDVTSAVKRLDREICTDLSRDFPLDGNGRFRDANAVQQRLQEVRPDLVDKKRRRAIVKRIEEENIAALKIQMPSANPPALLQTKQSPSIPLQASKSMTASSEQIPLTETEKQLYHWIQSQYLGSAFSAIGFVGWGKFQESLINQQPRHRDQIPSAIRRLRQPGHAYSLESPDKVQRAKSLVRQQQGGMQLAVSQPQTNIPQVQLPLEIAQDIRVGSLAPPSPVFNFTAGPTSSPSPAPATENEAVFAFGNKAEHKPVEKLGTVSSDSLITKMQRVLIRDETPSTSGNSSASEGSIGAFSAAQNTPRASTPDFGLYSQLLKGKKKGTNSGSTTKDVQRDIEQAPLLSGNVVAQHAHDLVPQYGLLGCLAGQKPHKSSSQLFLNTNVPISTFICGVQGSGKSHTTSCILENAVISSSHLGQLQSPVSTLVFNYGEWSSGGAGFNISEATYLAAPSRLYPDHQVKRITVLTSPSNLAIKRLYQRYPNVRIIPFRLKAKTLDISALSTLMAVDEKSTLPLYMAKVESILRAIAAKSEDGSLDYIKFKKMLKQEKFDPTQTTMLEMRLNLLESFLDLTGTAPEPDFLPGEITIMDLSDAFVSPNTACILFKLGLERFLQCAAPGKLVVLDEAHKYMLNTPGSKVLTDYLTKVIRLQRHLGARVIISTQEPTVSTDLIALCSVTVIHRFTSPAWYNALKKHINAMDDDEDTMHDIEGLQTGEALVYAPNAVLGKKDDGSLIKATGRLLKLNIRDRVTLDGGESIMAL